MCLLSIVITNYNYSQYLKQCLESCLFQQCDQEYEVLLIDDGSTDHSLEIANKYTEFGLLIFQQKNGGIETASNYGFEMARGQFVVRVDADDFLLPGYLETVLPKLRLDFGFLYGNYKVVDQNNKLISEMKLPDFDDNEILKRGDFLATGTIYPLKIIKELGYYNLETRNSGLENYELIINLLAKGLKGRHVDQFLFGYRRHGGNISSTRKDSIIMYGQKLFSERGLQKYGINQYHPYLTKL